MREAVETSVKGMGNVESCTEQHQENGREMWNVVQTNIRGIGNKESCADKCQGPGKWGTLCRQTSGNVECCAEKRQGTGKWERLCRQTSRDCNEFRRVLFIFMAHLMRSDCVLPR